MPNLFNKLKSQYELNPHYKLKSHYEIDSKGRDCQFKIYWLQRQFFFQSQLHRGKKDEIINNSTLTTQQKVFFKTNLFALSHNSYSNQFYKNVKSLNKKFNSSVFQPTNIFYFPKFEKTQKVLYINFLKKESLSSFFYRKNNQAALKFTRILLEYHRTHILQIIQQYKFPLLQDKTNQLLNFSRNKIRYKIFPLIRIWFLKEFDFILNNFLEISADQQNVFDITLKKSNQFLLFHIFLQRKNFILFSTQNSIRFKPETEFPLLPIPGAWAKNIFSNLSLSFQRKLIKDIYLGYTKKSLSFFQVEKIRLFLFHRR